MTHELGTGVLVCTFSETIDSTPATLQLDTAAAYFKNDDNDDNDDVVLRLDGAVVTEQDLLTLTLQVRRVLRRRCMVCSLCSLCSLCSMCSVCSLCSLYSMYLLYSLCSMYSTQRVAWLHACTPHY